MYDGKDLTETRTVIGTGGVFIYNPHAGGILSAGSVGNGLLLNSQAETTRALRRWSYLLYAVGLRRAATRRGAAAVRTFHSAAAARNGACYSAKKRLLIAYSDLVVLTFANSALSLENTQRFDLRGLVVVSVKVWSIVILSSPEYLRI